MGDVPGPLFRAAVGQEKYEAPRVPKRDNGVPFSASTHEFFGGMRPSKPTNAITFEV